MSAIRTNLIKVHYEITSIKAETTADQVIAYDIGMINVGLVFNEAAGSAKVQTTISSEDQIDADTATWTDWPAGAVAVDTEAVAYAPMGIRLVNVNGTSVTMNVRGNFGA